VHNTRHASEGTPLETLDCISSKLHNNSRAVRLLLRPLPLLLLLLLQWLRQSRRPSLQLRPSFRLTRRTQRQMLVPLRLSMALPLPLHV
jgi:hypothetical protein